MTRLLTFAASTALFATSAISAELEKREPNEIRVYKKTDQGVLKAHVFLPEGIKRSDKRPAVVFFFGGGWVGGSAKHFYQQAVTLSNEGMVAICPEYRTQGKHKTTPFECVEDGKSAMSWVRDHAKDFGIDPDRIVAAGGSAGGHVAACTGVIDGFDDGNKASSKPNLMILFNPVIDTTEKGYGMGKVGKDRKTEISPCHHVKKGIVPTLIFHGTKDTTVPFENVERFTKLMKEAGNECDLKPFEGKAHSFFNGSWFKPKNGDEDFDATMEMSIEFLKKHGYL